MTIGVREHLRFNHIWHILIAAGMVLEAMRGKFGIAFRLSHGEDTLC